MKKPALGRGLDAILGSRDEGRAQAAEPLAVVPEAVATGEPFFVDIDKVSPGRGQPRRKFDERALEELAASIREKGVLQPLVVTAKGGAYELIAGERRLRAAARAGLERVPVIVKREIEAGEWVELALIENIQREDLTPLEQARAYRRLADDHGLKQEEIAKRLGKGRTTIANSLRLLGLPEPVLDALERGLLSEGHARALLALETAAQQIAACKSVVTKSLSVRQTEELVRAMGHKGRAESRSRRKTDPALGALEETLVRSLGTRVRLRGTQSRGRIEIDFASPGELDRLVERLGR